MLRVMIADDEERICKLITALVNWESLDMEIAGIAHSGPEAAKMAEEIRPSILITDIRMPGCSGLDLIRQIKESQPELEIVIISGYAHFEYAQTAIKYGVGDYLLKPVNKAELNMTLQKFKERILSRKAAAESREQLFKKNENDLKRIRASLISQILEHNEEELTFDVLQEEYYLKTEPGCFQAVWLKFDCIPETVTKAGFSILMKKAGDLLENGLRLKCTEMVFGSSGSSYVGFINYRKEKQEDVRRVLRDCLNQLKSQQELYGPVQISLAVGKPVEKPEQLAGSVHEASLIIKERLVKGTGRILDKMPEPSSLHEQRLLEKYMRNVAHAVEVISVEEASAAVLELFDSVKSVKHVRGYEILELVHSCASLFFSRLEMKDRTELLQEFDERCEWCGSTEELFLLLRELLELHVGEIQKKHESDSDRPVRQAKEYIQNHFSEPITLEEVSSHVGLNPAYFSVLFKKIEGEGFAKYLIHLRVEKAKIFLRETNEPVAAICRKVGYNDVKHFTRTFEKDTGVKPAIYRKLYG